MSGGGAAGAAGVPTDTTGCSVLDASCSRADSECGDPLAYCPALHQAVPSCHDFGPGYCTCGRVQDSDCSSGEICLCGDAKLLGEAPLGECVKASYRSDADCAPGYFCVSNPGESFHVDSFSCQSPKDECGDEADCSPFGAGGAGFTATCSGSDDPSVPRGLRGVHVCIVPYCHDDCCDGG